jgi:hypothetical protein
MVGLLLTVHCFSQLKGAHYKRMGVTSGRISYSSANFNNISAISWLSVLLVEETGVPGKKPTTCRESPTIFIT